MKSYLRFVFSIFVLTCCTSLFAQNLVLNPSFEQTSACPQGISEFNLATYWAQGNSGADTCTTSDLYAGCTSQIGGSNSPNGLLGYQPSRTGDHHAGIILGEGFLGCTLLGDNYREYIEGTLSTGLTAGQRYLVRFYMSLPEGVMGGTDDFGVYFSNSYYQHNGCASQLMPVTPQLNYCGPPILDTVNWVEVRWIYTAVGGETYLTIGNFKNDANTTVAPHNCSSFNPYIYYYIDDVEVSPVGPNDCPFTLDMHSTNAGCVANDGKAQAIVTGCTTPFTYAWSTGSHSDTINNVAAGAYQITVTDAGNCSSTASVTVGSYTGPTLLLATVNASCGQTNGSATANVTVGVPPYTYHWSTGASTSTITNLGAGSYTVTVTGAGSCTATAVGNINSSSGNLTLNTATTNANCGALDGTASVNVTGGTGPFTYNWSNGQTTQSISGLAPGNYTVTVQSSSSVSPTPFYSEDFTSGGTGWTLNTSGPGTNGANPNKWVVNNDNNCTCGSGKYLHVTCDNAAIFCFPTAGQCSYFPGPSFAGDPTADKFSSSPAISTVGHSNMVLKFTYTVGGETNVDYGTVRLSNDGGSTWTDLPTKYSDSINCTSASVSIPSNYENISNFKIAFRWINDANGNGDDPGFAVDDIQLIEQGGSACPSVASVTVGSTSAVTASATSTSAGCTTGGTATAQGAGTGPFTYSWSNGGNTATISNLAAGSYTVTVTGAGNCTATATTQVTSIGGAFTLNPTTTDAICTSSNGSATATANGTGPFTYAWSNGANTATITNVAAGNYSVTVNGSGGCSASANVVVNSSSNLTINATATTASCNQSNGSATVAVSTGNSPYSYSWSNGGNTATISNLNAGNYSVTVNSNDGCSATATTTVVSPNGVTAAAISTNTTCGHTDGTATASSSTGTSPFVYVWSNGATTAYISNLAPATYTVTITDANSCSGTASTVVSPSGLSSVTISADKTVMCSGDSAHITTQGTFASYAWNTGATTPDIYVKLAGNYYVTVTDNGNCSVASNHLAINVYPLPSVSISINGDTLRAYNSPTYQWYFNGNLINGATSAMYIALQTGYYSVQVSDSNGCHALSNPALIQVTGINDLMQTANIRVYPNPLETGSWNLEVDNSWIGGKVEIFDDNGRLVYNTELRSLKSEIGVNVASGVYILRINSEQKSFTQKLIKLQ